MSLNYVLLTSGNLSLNILPCELDDLVGWSKSYRYHRVISDDLY